ncbi:MAG: formylglycine-generating enzyme family protein [Wenzhouxiangellaceae bacterium]
MKLWLLCIATALALGFSPARATAQEEDPVEEESSTGDEPEEERGVRRLGDVIGEGTSDFSMDIPQIDMPTGPVSDQPNVSLPDPVMDDRLQNIMTRRAFVPDNPEIEQELVELLDEVEAEARQALADGDVELASRFVNVIAAFDGEREVIAEVEAASELQSEVARLLGQADQALESGNLVEPAEASAWTLYQQVAELDPGNEAASAGLDAVRERLLVRTDELLDESNFEAAEALLARAEDMQFDAAVLEQRRATISSAREDQQRVLINQTRLAIDDGDFDQAEDMINQLIGMGLADDEVDRLRSSLDDAIRYSGFEPGQLFQDGLADGDAYGPVMVVIPSGSFMMGSPEGEEDRVGNEGPRFRVTFDRGFALSRNEVTVGQFRRFVESTGYQTDAERSGASRIYMSGSGRVAERRRITWENDYLGDQADESLPVIHVSWNDANAYANWLAEQTDRAYRLPAEAEFEYALRAGSQTRFWWGDGSPDDVVENLTGDGDQFTDQRRWTVAFRRYDDGYWGPAPVGSFAANPFGLFDMGGNVMEWVLDCWHDSYVRAPGDGSAWVNPGCDRRVIRGASWSSTPAMSRSAFRLSSQTTATDARVGFRVARDL